MWWEGGNGGWVTPYLGLEGSLQGAEGTGRRDHGWDARHGWGVGVKQL